MFKSKLIFTALALCCSSAYAQTYRVTPLPGGFSPSFVKQALNNHGLVVGIGLFESSRGPQPNIRVFDSTTNMFLTSGADFSGLFTSDWRNNVSNVGINVRNQVVGTRRDGMGSNTTFLLQPDSSGLPYAISYPFLSMGGLTDSRIYAPLISDNGWMISTNVPLLGDFLAPRRDYRGLVWMPDADNSTTGIHYPLLCSGSPYSFPQTITDNKLIGGSCGSKAKIWIYGADVNVSDWFPEQIKVRVDDVAIETQMVDRATFAAHSSCSVEKITNRNNFFIVNCEYYFDVAGDVGVTSSSRYQSVSFISTSGSLRTDQVFINLAGEPMDNGQFSTELFDINNEGCAVGRSVIPLSARWGDVRVKPIVYCSGNTTDLSSYGGGRNGLLTTSINDRGQILLLWGRYSTSTASQAQLSTTSFGSVLTPTKGQP